MIAPSSSNAIGQDALLPIRNMRWDDLNAVTQLIYEVCEAEGDTSVAVTPEDLTNEWKYEGFSLEQDAFLAETHAGRAVGYAALFDIRNHCEWSGDIYVHPKFKEPDLVKALLRAMETRALELGLLSPPDQRVFIHVPIDNKDESGKAIFAQEGYLPIRYHWRMGIDLVAALPEPILPTGLEIRPFVKDEHAAAVWQARNEAFKDNLGSHALTFEEFSYFTFDNPEYDPTLWTVIWDGKEVAGFSINHNRMGIGWIHMLGVRPAWRKRGLGLALLQHSFGEFYRRGTKAIGLGVDATNATEATRLYQKAGMHTVNAFVTFEKELRAGKPVHEPNALTFWNVRDEHDYPILLDINRSSRQADKNNLQVTLEDIAHALAHMDGLTPQQGVVIASLGDTPVGYSRLGWYSSRPDTRLFYQISFLRQEYREGGFWQAMVQHNERCLQEIAAAQATVAKSYFQAWASDYQKDWMAVLEDLGYLVVRRFNNMLYRFGEAPIISLPAGFEIRPVRPEHMRAVWEAQKEMNAGLFENVAEDWLEEKYPAWLSNPENNPRFWQVAWSGNQLAGMVLAHINEKENAERNRQLGYTEHIYVRPQWRGQGLASALIARSLQVLKDQGMMEAELGVDSENESAAFRLYQRLGYQTYSIDTWYRKPMQ